MTSELPTHCARVREDLSAYLDGDLEGERGGRVRGHLRECDACRAISIDEAALRDGLRALEPVDPPASLWAGVQARLAAAEVEASHQPAWRRVLAGWRDAITGNLRPIAVGAAFAAAALVFVVWKHRAAESVDDTTVAVAPAAAQHDHDKQPDPPASRQPDVPSADDITADLAREPARIAHDYETAATEALALADTARQAWPDDKRAQYDAQLAKLRGAITGAASPKAAQRGWRALIRFAQGAVVRDELALADIAAGGMH